ncbi:MAG: hypothetical protein KIS87_14510 [Phycisphaeraceae bacterium]|nr:hypothetical protein [Phycisphaeraceae bacterium]
MRRRKARIRDDRDRVFSVARVDVDWSTFDPEVSDFGLAVARQSLVDESEQVTPFAAALFMLMAGVAVVLGLLLAFGFFSTQKSRSEEILIGMALVLLGHLFAWLAIVPRRLHRRHRADVSGVLASCLRCPVCEGSLAGLLPDPDGCTPCPECGAAWRIDAGPKEQAP